MTKEEKQYNNLSSVEKHIIREHDSWKKSDCDISYKLEMLTQLRKRAVDCKIDHLL